MPQPNTKTRTVTSAAAYRQKRQEGTLWDTPSGATVRVRDLDISDHAVVGVFPDNLQQMIYKQIEHSATLRRNADGDDEDAAVNPFEGLSGQELLAREYEIGITLVKLGWMEPQVVDEVTDDETQIAAADVDPRDRRAFMARVFGGGSAEAQQLATFPRQS